MPIAHCPWPKLIISEISVPLPLDYKRKSENDLIMFHPAFIELFSLKDIT